jgi:hypothetical protein
MKRASFSCVNRHGNHKEEPKNVKTHKKTKGTTQKPLLLKTMYELKRDTDNIGHKDKQNTNTTHKTRTLSNTYPKDTEG